MLCQLLTEKQHLFAPLLHIYFHLPGKKQKKKYHSESDNKPEQCDGGCSTHTHTAPCNNALLPGNRREIVHGGVSATPGCSSAWQFSWMCQYAFAISRFSQKVLYYSFLRCNRGNVMETAIGEYTPQQVIQSSVNTEKYCTVCINARFVFLIRH